MDSAGAAESESAASVEAAESVEVAEPATPANEPWPLPPLKRPRRPDPKPKPPTVRQVYALAAALCAFTDQEFPRTREEASDLIERLRIDIGHPEPSLPEPPPPSRRARRFARGARPD